MKKIFIKLTIAFATLSSVAFAQQDAQFTQFMHSKLIYNPGYAGTSEAICANVLYRNQWVNFPGAPKTGLVSFDMPIGKLPIAIGVNVMNDQIGIDKTNFARIAVAYNKILGAGILGIGIDGGIIQKQFNNQWITPDGAGVVDASIPNYTSGTGTLSTNPNLNKFTYDLGFGAFYSIANKMYIGLSSSHLAANDIKSNANVKFSLSRHYFLMAGYTFNLSPDHSLTPNVNIKTDAASTQLDLNLTYMYKNTFWVGATYRMQDAIAPMLGYKFQKGSVRGLKIGYSYDVTTSTLKGHSSGSHEIMLGYCFKNQKPKPVSSYGNTRFLD